MTLGWAKNWQKNHWLLQSKKPAKNIDLWQKILSLAQKHRINWFWLKGHGDNPDNKRCDQLAVLASNEDNLPEDEGFKQSCPL
jgi:ribonuclease HI